MSYNYITTNEINGKQYVGMSTKNRDSYKGSGILLHKAMKKYGKENFKKEILCECDTIEQAYENEGLFIKQYNTLDPNGYNLSPMGGLGLPGSWKHNKETKKKISEHCSFRKPEIIEKIRQKTTGQKRSKETCDKIGAIHKGKTVITSDETKQILREKSLNVKRIKCEHCEKEFTPWGFANHSKKLTKIKI
jgi:group I intron endonuclease